MNADEIVRALRENAEWCDANEYEVPLCMGDNQRAAVDLIESLQAQLSTSQRREKAAVGDLTHTIHNCKFSKCCDMAHATNPKHDTCFTCSLWEWRGPQ